MGRDHRFAAWARWHRLLLLLLPKDQRERFGGEMEQVFRDRLNEHDVAGRPLLGPAAAMCADTGLQAARERLRSLMSVHRNLIRIALGVGALLLVPLIAMQITAEVQWTAFDFAVAGGALFLAGAAFDALARQAYGSGYRLAAVIAVGASVLLFWINGAVGIGSDTDTPNILYLLVPVIGLLGALAARLRPAGMALALLAMAAAHATIGLSTLMLEPASLSLGETREIVAITLLFVAAYLASASLFRQSAPAQPRTA